MPAWWGRKSSKNKGQQQEQKQEQQQQVVNQNPLSYHLHPSKSSVNNDKTKGKDKGKPVSFDDGLLRNSPRTSKDFGASSGFLGFDSDSGERIGHPLPRPSILAGHDNISLVVGCGSGSISSVSSSGSSEDQPIAQDNGQSKAQDQPVAQENGQFLTFRLVFLGVHFERFLGL